MKRASGFVLSLALIAQACGPAPQAEPTTSAAPSLAASTEPSSASASAPAEPTPSATASGSVSVTWEHVGLPEPGAELTTGIWDDGQWIVGGFEWCDEFGWCSRIWTSDDGRTWTRAELPDEGGFRVTALARAVDGYVAAVLTCEANGVLKTSTAGFWRSADATSWERLGSVKLGTIAEDCLGIDHIAAIQAGLIGTTELRKASPSHVLQSSDGVDWTPLSSDAFGLKADASLYELDMVQVDPSAAIVASACAGCRIAVWRSGDGGAWTEIGRIDAEDPVYKVSAALGPRVVVARFTIDGSDSSAPCITEGGDVPDHSSAPCRTSVWALHDDGSFHAVGDIELGYRPHLASLGDAYVVLGTGQGPGESRAFASADGLAWTRISTDTDVCGAEELIGGPSQALLLSEPYDFYDESDPDCAGGMWLIDVTPA